ncbi:MAG TPA: nucleotidyl transferase AbiEii/AbiGii toxin family protein [Fimbriimonas sp.]
MGHRASAQDVVVFSAESYRRFAEESGFRQETLEKVIRLGQIAGAVSQAPELATKLALKGGTAINLMADPIRRLSVDLDYNYVGAVDREAMLKDKPEVLEAFLRAVESYDYRADSPRDEHGGSKLLLRYRNSLGGQDQIEIDISWINRIPLGPLQRRPLWQPKDLERPEVQMVCTEELIAGKLRALIDRVAARDVFDAGFLPALLEGDWPSPLAKALFVLYTGTLPLPLASYTADRLNRLTEADYKNKLLPVLSLADVPDRTTLIERAKQVLSPMLELTEGQREYVDRLQRGEYRPDLVLPFDTQRAAALLVHPALLWKAQNAKAHHQAKSRQR